MIEKTAPQKSAESAGVSVLRMKDAWLSLGRQLVAGMSKFSAALSEAYKQARLYTQNEPYIKPTHRPGKLRKRRKTQYSRRIPY